MVKRNVRRFIFQPGRVVQRYKARKGEASRATYINPVVQRVYVLD